MSRFLRDNIPLNAPTAYHNTFLLLTYGYGFCVWLGAGYAAFVDVIVGDTAVLGVAVDGVVVIVGVCVGLKVGKVPVMVGVSVGVMVFVGVDDGVCVGGTASPSNFIRAIVV